jgi:hypothetical protein
LPVNRTSASMIISGIGRDEEVAGFTLDQIDGLALQATGEIEFGLVRRQFAGCGHLQCRFHTDGQCDGH